MVGANTRAEKLVMLQTLLADRFKLVLHPEMHEMPVMALIATRAWKGRSAPSADGDPRVVIRGAGGASKVRSVYFDGHNVTLASIGNYVASRLGRVVVDQTRLAGAFDFHVAVPIDAERATSPNVPEREVASDLVRDFMDKLGLKLESRRATVKILVVDHAEPPSDN